MYYLKEYDSFSPKIGDIVLIHYWYNYMICKVKIIGKMGRKYEVSFDTENSPIFNAPNEYIFKSEMIDYDNI